MTPAKQSTAPLESPGERYSSDASAFSQPEGGSLTGRLNLAVPGLFVLATVVLIVQDQGGYFPTSFGWSIVGLLAALATWALAGGITDAGRRDALFFASLAALTGWVGLSILWSVDPAQSVIDLQRWLVLLSGCGAFLVLAQRVAFEWTALALMAAISAVCGYSLWTRLFPQAGNFDPSDVITGYRLDSPVGYWNALAAFAVVGALLALAHLTEPSVGRVGRALAAVGLTITPLTVYFTFSRGAWLAFAGGLLVAIALSPHRLRLVSEGALFAVPPVVAILIASRSPALVDVTARLGPAQSEGRALAAYTVALCLLAVSASLAVSWLERRLAPGAQLRRVYGGVLLAVCVVAAAVVLVHEGGPISLVTRGYDSFADPTPPGQTANLNSRLFTINGDGRAQLWSVAISSLAGHWLTGTGAGSFQRNWDHSPKADEVVKDAHGLYVQTLSELGIVGLVLLLVVLVLPIVTAVQLRQRPLIAGLLSAYVAFILHNAVDWDWQLSGVALTGLLLGCLLLVAYRQGAERRVPRSWRGAGGVVGLAIAAFALVAIIGNGALARAQSANLDKDYTTAAADAVLAHTWMPWSSAPPEALGEARLEQDNVAGARAAFLQAISIDRRDWQAWLDLAATVKNDSYALAQAKALYPTSPEIVEFENSTSH